MVYIPRKAALILMLIMGLICLTGGIAQHKTTTLLVGIGALIYSIVGFVMDSKKKKEAKKNESSVPKNGPK